MSDNAIQVMIVEDDAIAAKIYEQFTHKLEGFRIVATASSGAQAEELLQVFTPDLMLLDVFLPDIRGIELLWSIRQFHRTIDVILITAANDTETVSEAIRGGAFSYIMKPILIDKFTGTLERYKALRKQLHERQIVDQHEVDQFFRPADGAGPGGKSYADGPILPKGIDKLTLRLLRDRMKAAQESVSTDELSAIAGMSHSTVRRYLEYMVAAGEVEVDILYGTVGRPERKYRWLQKK